MRQPNILLTSEEIAIVNNLIPEKPVRAVAAKIGRSMTALHYYLKHRNNYPPPTSKAIGPSKEKDKQSEKPVKMPPSKRLRAEPIIMGGLQVERQNFAKEHRHWSEGNWAKVIFHGERKFHLDGPDGFTEYYHDMRNSERLFSSRPRGNAIYIWMAISYGGQICYEISKTKFKPDAPFEFLQRERPRIIELLEGKENYLLQDRNNSFRKYTTLHKLPGVKTQQWPSIAYDVDIMETMWSFIIREIYENGTYSRRNDLIFAVQLAWTHIPIDFIQNLYSTLPERMKELCRTSGGCTNF